MSKPHIPWWRTNLGRDEISRIEDAILHKRITQGPLTEKLEKQIGDFLGGCHVVMTTNGSMALLAALIECGVSPGDEVIVPAMSYVATANAPLLLGAKVRLVDVRPDLPLVDPEKIEEGICEKTKAILPVHLGGRGADLAKIWKIAKEHGVFVIEDAAQAFGSKSGGKWLGTQSHMGCFSMSITKLITTGEGGFCATNSEQTASRLKKIRNSGAAVLAENRFDTFGFNLRQNDLLSSMGLAQMEKIEGKMERIHRVYQFYKSALSEMDFVKLVEVDTQDGQLPLWVEVLVQKRDEVIKGLLEKGIQAKAYSPVISDSPFIDCDEDFANARFFADHGMILPCGPDQPLDDLEKVVEALKIVGSELKLNPPTKRN